MDVHWVLVFCGRERCVAMDVAALDTTADAAHDDPTQRHPIRSPHPIHPPLLSNLAQLLSTRSPMPKSSGSPCRNQ